MKNKKVFQKIVFVALIVLILFSLVAPAIFAQTLTAPKEEKLLNGLKVLMWPDAKADKVAIRIRVHSGAAFDPQGKEGVMQLLADNIFPNEASKEFFTEDLGGSLDVVSNYDYIEINASSKADTDSFLKMLETLASAVANPVIDKEQTAKLRTALLAKVTAWEADPSYLADQAAARRLFGTFPYGRPEDGSVGSLAKIDFADLIDAKQRFLTADNATVTIAGNFDRNLSFRAIRRFFGAWLKSDKKTPSTFRQPDEPDTKPLQITLPTLEKQHTRSAKKAPSRSNSKYYAMLIYAAIKTEQRCPDSGRYSANLLFGSYVVRREVNPNDLPLYSGPCPMPKQDPAGHTFYPFSESDFTSAKERLLADLQTRLSSPAGIAGAWLDVATYKLVSPEDELKKARAVSFSDVKNISDEIMSEPAVTVTLVPQSPAK